jgi:hypothetical protein
MLVASPDPVLVQKAHSESRIIDPTATKGWDRWLEYFPDATAFHTAAWAAVLKRTYGHIPLYLVEKLVDGKSAPTDAGGYAPHPPSPIPDLPSAILPLMEIRSRFTGRRGVCLPFTDQCGKIEAERSTTTTHLPSPICGPKSAPTDPAERDGYAPHLPSPITHLPSPNSHLLDFPSLLSLARSRRWRSFELRGGEPPAPDAIPSQTFYQHTLDLRNDPDRLFERCDPATRRAVRKAERAGFDVELGHTLGALHEFYTLHGQTRRKHGLPPQPFSFFLAIHDEIISRGKGFITVARRGLEPIAAAVFLHFGKHAIYKFGASDETHLELRANNLVMWDSIRWLARNGFHTLDFGRTSTNQDGLRRFKLGWGTRECRLQYYRYDLRSDRFVTVQDHAHGWHNALFSRLPLPVNRLFGAVVYRHLD